LHSPVSLSLIKKKKEEGNTKKISMCGKFGTLLAAVIAAGVSFILLIVSVAAPWLVFTYSSSSSSFSSTLTYTFFLTYFTVSGVGTFPYNDQNRICSLLSNSCRITFQAAASFGAASIALFAIAFVLVILGGAFGIIRAIRLRKTPPPPPSCPTHCAASVTPTSVAFVLIMVGGI